jgi:hypothetical protein
MPHYKSSDQQLHWIEDDSLVDVLPKGCVKITEAEADRIRASSIVPPSYSDLRAAEYPPITDYLDAIVKNDKVAIKTYIDACKAVKDKYPKPVTQNGSEQTE